LRVAIVAVGKIRTGPLRGVLEDYYERIRRYAKLEEIELKDDSPEQVRQRIEKSITARARTIALEVEGQAWNSRRLAKYLGDCEVASVPGVSFVIGGAYGLPPDLRADVRLSLSAMTLPHRLARLLLAEQIYRAFTILRGEPYSHD
jgi:23S rRNA (pseudouridine1915-N3)-methyltransferase